MSRGKLDIVEAAYRLEITSELDWISGVGELFFRAMGCAQGLAYTFSCKNGVPTPDYLYSPIPELVEELPGLLARLSPEVAAIFHDGALMAGSARARATMAGLAFEDTPLFENIRAWGMVDAFGAPSLDHDGQGALLCAALPEVFDNPREALAWSRVSAHILSALRLRRRLAGASAVSRADAILDVDGRLADARDDEAAGARDNLREAVKRIDRARARAATDEHDLPRWQGLVDGRWSVVDHFEGSGRRYYVAVRNPPNGHGLRRLSQSERSVLGFALSGTSQKVGAYALGVSATQFSRTLSRAMKKIGVRSRPELVELGVSLRSATISALPGAPLAMLARDAPVLPESLTEAERTVVRHVMAGQSNAEIANERGTSERTVSNQLAAIYVKLDVVSREELVARVFGG